MKDKDDDVSLENLNNNSIWFRLLLVASLVGGAGGGIGFVAQDSGDKYRKAQAVKDFRLRDQSIARMQEDVRDLEEEIKIINRRIQEESREAEEDLKAHRATEHRGGE